MRPVDALYGLEFMQVRASSSWWSFTSMMVASAVGVAALADAHAPVLAGARSVDADVIRLVDDTGVVAIEVPTTWADVDTAPAVNPDGSARPYIAASSDLDALFATFDVPGVVLTAIPLTDDVQALIEGGGLTGGCASIRVEPIVEPEWDGVVQIGERCGATGNGAWNMAVANDASGELPYTLVLQAQAANVNDAGELTAVRHAIQSAGAASVSTPPPPTSAAPVAAPATAATTSAVPPPSDPDIDLGELNGQLAGVMALPPDQQAARLAELDTQLARQVAAISGLAEAVGGPDAAASAMAANSAALIDRIEAVDVTSISSFRTATAPTIGEGMFAGYMGVGLLGQGMLRNSDGWADGRVEDVSRDGTTAHIEAGSVQVGMDATQTSGAITTTMTLRTDIQPCPDAAGHVEITAHLDVSATAGSVGQRGTLDVNISIDVGDDAEIASATSTFRMQYADFAGGRGQFVDVSGDLSAVTTGSATVNRTGASGVTPEIRQTAISTGAFYALMMYATLADSAKTAWQSGRCVRVDVSAAPGPAGLAPGSQSTITALPRSRIDGRPVGGTVTAVLSGGEAAVTPSSTPVPADAEFTYDAPGERNRSGTVQLEARSKRGIARATIEFDTKQAGYVASGGTTVTFTGAVADLAAPFTLIGTGPGFTVEFSFTPTSAAAGTLTYTGSGGGASLTGTGTYTITGDDPDLLTLNYNAEGCANPGGCRSTSNAITLTAVTSPRFRPMTDAATTAVPGHVAHATELPDRAASGCGPAACMGTRAQTQGSTRDDVDRLRAVAATRPTRLAESARPPAYGTLRPSFRSGSPPTTVVQSHVQRTYRARGMGHIGTCALDRIAEREAVARASARRAEKQAHRRRAGVPGHRSPCTRCVVIGRVG